MVVKRRAGVVFGGVVKGVSRIKVGRRLGGSAYFSVEKS